MFWMKVQDVFCFTPVVRKATLSALIHSKVQTGCRFCPQTCWVFSANAFNAGERPRQYNNEFIATEDGLDIEHVTLICLRKEKLCGVFFFSSSFHELEDQERCIV